MFLAFRRIIKTGFINFWRNGFVSVSSIVVMTITLFVICSLFFLNALMQSSLTMLKEKVDINAYFLADASEDAILALKQQLEGFPEVLEVTYTSREEALARFEERHAQDAIELQAIKELGTNPLLASLSIKAVDPIHYERINTFLETDPSTLSSTGDSSIISKVNFNDNRTAIERLRQVIRGIELFGLILSSVLVGISIVIVFNTIRMAIFISREEISVMRLVGASDMYIRGPFVFEGMMYGFVAALITLVSYYPLAIWLGPGTQQFFGNINLFTFYTNHFGQIFVTIVATGIFLGGLSSFLAVKRYLRV